MKQKSWKPVIISDLTWALMRFCHYVCGSFLDGSSNSESWWSYDMDMLSALLALCEGNPPITGGFPSHKKCPSHQLLNTLRPIQNGHHFADAIFKWIFLNENVWIPLKISLKFVPQGPINNIPALVQIMAWRGPGDKLLSGPMMVRLLTYICVTQPQWVNPAIIGGFPSQRASYTKFWIFYC